MPELDQRSLQDLERLSASWCWRDAPPKPIWSACLQDGDGLVDYLGEIERYRNYVCTLRGEEGCE